MIKKLFIFLVIFFNTEIQAQTAIEGIGKIRLEMSLNEVKKAFPKMLIPTKACSKFKRAYKINTYTPIKNHTLKNIHLYFYNDTLYAFYIKDVSPYLKYSLKTKYGEPKEKRVNFSDQILEIASIYEYDSADFLLEATKRTKNDISTFFYTWNEGNPFLQCVLIESVYTDEKNKRDMDIMFYMKNRATAKLIETKEKLQELEDKEKRKQDLEGL